jgi:hypothetical protein
LRERKHSLRANLQPPGGRTGTYLLSQRCKVRQVKFNKIREKVERRLFLGFALRLSLKFASWRFWRLGEKIPENLFGGHCVRHHADHSGYRNAKTSDRYAASIFFSRAGLKGRHGWGQIFTIDKQPRRNRKFHAEGPLGS